MQKLGVLLNSLGPNQLAYYFIKNTNALMLTDKSTDIIGFYDNICIPCIPTRFAIMHSYEGYGYDAPMIATTFNSANKLLKFPGSLYKYFYVWDLEWLRMPSKNFHMLAQIYRNPKLKLIARCVDHQKVLSQAWNVRVDYVVEDCDINSLLEIASAPSN